MNKYFWVLIIIFSAGWFLFGGKTEIKNLGNSGQTVVAFGDSLTAGYGAGKDKAYPAVLGRMINRPVVNLGLSGDTAAKAPARLPQVLQANPYMVLIEFGGNDYMRSVPFEETEQAIRQIVDEVQSAGAIAVLVDTGGYPGMSRYTKLYKQIAKEKQALFVPGILDGIFGKSKYKADPIHPNAAGYEIVAQKVHKAIKPYL